MASSYCPRGLENAGRRLWRAVCDEYELAEHERLLLVEACRTADTLDRLAATAAGIDVPAPVLVEARQQRLVLGRLLAQLKLPDGLTSPPSDPSPVKDRSQVLRRTGS